MNNSLITNEIRVQDDLGRPIIFSFQVDNSEPDSTLDPKKGVRAFFFNDGKEQDTSQWTYGPWTLHNLAGKISNVKLNKSSDPLLLRVWFRLNSDDFKSLLQDLKNLLPDVRIVLTELVSQDETSSTYNFKIL